MTVLLALNILPTAMNSPTVGLCPVLLATHTASSGLPVGMSCACLKRRWVVANNVCGRHWIH